MRKITIKRHKCFTASLIKMKVYVSSSDGDTVINNVSYTKVGEVKNGGEFTFEADEKAVTVAVIADKASKDYCNGTVDVPAGQDDVYLSGKNVLNPALGNAFCFDGAAESPQQQRKKSGIGIIIIIAAAVLGLVAGFLITSGALSGEHEFNVDGFSITLPSKFSKAAQPGFAVCFDSRDMAVLVSYESFADNPAIEQYTQSEYGGLVIINNQLGSGVHMQQADNLDYFEYDAVNTQTKDEYHYYSCVLKGTDGFWTVQFAGKTADFERNRASVPAWAASVKVR